jgi:hypothetical protein
MSKVESVACCTCAYLDVSTGCERLLARTRQHNGTYAVVARECFVLVTDLKDHVCVQRIHCLGAVDGEGGNGTLLIDINEE